MRTRQKRVATDTWRSRQISYDVSMGWGNESLFKRSWSMTKMAAMPIYDKNLKKLFFSETKRPMTLKLSMQHWVLEYYQVYSNDDTGLTLTYFTARSNLSLMLLYGKKVKHWIFSETIVVYDLKLAIDDRSDKTFLLTSKLCPLGDVCPLPRGYIHVLNHEKNV